jgi:hypothetical protein
MNTNEEKTRRKENEENQTFLNYVPFEPQGAILTSIIINLEKANLDTWQQEEKYL